MKTIHFRLVFLAILAVVIFAANIAEPSTFGITAEWSDAGYRIAGGTAPWALGLSVLIWLFYILLMQEHKGRLDGPLPGVFRRFFAFWIDFTLAVFAVTPVTGLIPSFVEWRRTGIFEWSFERTVAARGDGLLITVVLMLSVPALVIYFALPLLRGKPSPGSCIAGYQVIIDEGEQMGLRKAVLRTSTGFFAVATAYAAPFLFRDRRRGKFWLDAAFKTHAVKLG